MANSAWGIDLGNRALKAVKLVREDDRIRIDDFEVIEHEQILSVAGDNKESLLQTALANFVERHQTKGSAVGVSVSGQQSFARFIKLPPVEPKKIPEIIRFEAIQQIPFPLDDVEWSYQLFQDKDSPDVEVGIFAMKKELVNRQIAYFTNLKLNVQVVQMHPLAVYNAMDYDGRTDQTVMFMDTGAENTDLIIADGQTVWLRTLPIGGNTFTETLAKSFRLSFQKAEELKRNAATSKYAKQIFQAMRPVFADLVAEIQRSIGFYASVHRDARIQKIVAQGSTFQLPGLQKYLQQNLQLPVEKLDAFRALPPADTKVAANLSENLICLAGAYGLALQALGEAKITSSLLPEAIRRAKMWKEKAKWFQLAAAMVVAGTLGVGARAFLEHGAYDNNEEIRRNNRAVLANAKRLSGEWRSDVENKGEEERNQVKSIRSLLDYRDVWPSIMQDILSSVPANDMARFTKEKQEGKKREDRQQILITSIHPSYYGTEISAPLAAAQSDLMQYTVAKEAPGSTAGPAARPMAPGRMPQWMTSGLRGRGFAPPPPVPTADSSAESSSDSKKRGFVITIRGVTPYKDGSKLLNSTLISSLTAKTVEQQLKLKKPYYVARVALVSIGKRQVAEPGSAAIEGEADPFAGEALAPTADAAVSTVPSAATATPGIYGRDRVAAWAGRGVRTPYGRNPYRPAVMPTTPQQGQTEQEGPDPSLDRFFPDEKITNDWQFTVLVMIVMDPEPPQSAETATPTE